MVFEPADRIKALPPYLFVAIDRKKRAALQAGKDVINFGIGDPDQPTFGHIVDRARQALDDPKNHRYPHDQGALEFREQAAAFFERRYGVTLDPNREIHTLIGTKEGLGHLPLAVVNPGRTVLLPEPGYPVYRSATIFAGGKPWTMRLDEAGGWLPDFEAIPADVARSAVLMVLNYPNNPTGAVADLALFERAVAFARDNEIVIAHDAAYSEMYFDDPPPSILQVPGAREVAVEFHSLSKTFNMTGWRLGFVAGNSDVIAALSKIKSNVDSGQFTAIQQAGATAYAQIDGPDLPRMRTLYRERAQVLAAGLRELGFRLAPPKATFYLWAGVPSGHDSMGMVTKLLDEAAVVCIPGTGFGQAGEGYVRFALTVDVDRTRMALGRMRELKW